jgi:hypothetical protein
MIGIFFKWFIYVQSENLKLQNNLDGTRNSLSTPVNHSKLLRLQLINITILTLN